MQPDYRFLICKLLFQYDNGNLFSLESESYSKQQVFPLLTRLSLLQKKETNKNIIVNTSGAGLSEGLQDRGVEQRKKGHMSD